jgi:DNA-binding MarR family transcriptional regulator
VGVKHSPLGAAMTDLILQTFRLNGLLLSEGDRLTKGLGLTSARWQVMGALADGPLTAAQIARNMGLRRQSVQRLVDLLETENIVVFEPNPHHRSAMLVRLTEEGQRKYARISQVQARWVNGLSLGFEVRKIENAVALLRDVQTRLQQSRKT